MRAGVAKRDRDWDHTAEMIASIATLATGKRYTLNQCHPFRVSHSPDLDDPEREYNRLMRAQATKTNGKP